MKPETFFLALRIYGAVASFAAAFIIWLYSRLVANPRFSRFVRKFWIFKICLGIQRTISIFYIDFFFSFNNVQSVAVTAIILTWIFFGVLKEYRALKRSRATQAKMNGEATPTQLADKALDDLNYKC